MTLLSIIADILVIIGYIIMIIGAFITVISKNTEIIFVIGGGVNIEEAAKQIDTIKAKYPYAKISVEVIRGGSYEY